jgi:hypothetical protein
MPYSHAHSHYHLLRMKEMGRVYWCHSVGAAGVGVISIFTSIYLLKNGFSFSAVIGFLFMQQLFSTAMFRPAAELLQLRPPNQALASGSLFFMIFLGMLSTINIYHWPLWLIALVWSLNRTTYWTAFHYLFSLSRAHVHGGRQIAKLAALITVGGTVAPAIGGIIATAFGITYSYMLAVGLLFVAIAPLLFDKTGPERASLSFSRVDIRNMRSDLIAQLMNGAACMADQNIWPIFIFLLVSSYAGIGTLSTAIAVASVVVTIYVGRKQEQKGERTYIKRGMATSSMANIGRVLAHNGSQIFSVNLLTGIGRALYVTPYMNRYYHNADGEHRLGYVVAMEIAFSLGGSAHMLLLLGLSLFLSAKIVLSIGFSIAAVCILGLRLIR